MAPMLGWYRRMGLLASTFALVALLFGTTASGCIVHDHGGRSSRGVKRGHSKRHPGKKKGHHKKHKKHKKSKKHKGRGRR